MNKYINGMKSSQQKVSTKILGEMIGFAIAWLVMVVILPKLGFVTSGYELWMPIGVSAALISAVTRSIGKILGGRWKYALELVAVGAGWYSVYMLIQIYPFDFESIGKDNLDQFLRLGLYVGLFGTSIAMIVNFVYLIVGPKEKRDTDSK